MNTIAFNDIVMQYPMGITEKYFNMFILLSYYSSINLTSVNSFFDPKHANVINININARTIHIYILYPFDSFTKCAFI